VAATTSAPPGFPPAPPASLDPYLDAAAACFVRYGVRRTSVQDIAAELKVDRTTVYRQVGNVDSIVRLLAARELHRHLGEAMARADLREVSPRSIVRTIAHMCTLVREHPVMAKVLADERELLGADELAALFRRVAALSVPALKQAMDLGAIARRNPTVLSEWVARISATVILAPPPGNLERFLGEVLLPVLTPAD
jgi:AcrR family transcriptional regulator